MYDEEKRVQFLMRNNDELDHEEDLNKNAWNRRKRMKK
jgi:hypothetical protein